MTVLKWMKKEDRVCGCGLNLSGSGHGPVAGSCEHNN
jgi:hypothetical protein